MSHTVVDFLAMMSRFNVPVNNEIQIGSTGYLDKPVKDVLFTGVDAKGRVFVNLPVIYAASKAIQQAADRFDNTAFVVFQRYINENDVFVSGGPILFPDKFCGDGSDDLSDLEKLLSGETVRRYYSHWTPSEGYSVDQDRWVEITLKR